MFCDLLWADPVPDEESSTTEDFKPNDDRDTSFFYGRRAVKKLLDANHLISILRAHQVQVDGYKMHRFHDGPASKASSTAVSQIDFPSVITIFSAPNYCGSYDNKGAYFTIEKGTVRVK